MLRRLIWKDLRCANIFREALKILAGNISFLKCIYSALQQYSYLILVFEILVFDINIDFHLNYLHFPTDSWPENWFIFQA